MFICLKQLQLTLKHIYSSETVFDIAVYKLDMLKHFPKVHFTYRESLV